MTFVRSVFAFAILMLLLGMIGSRMILTSMFSGAPGSNGTYKASYAPKTAIPASTMKRSAATTRTVVSTQAARETPVKSDSSKTATVTSQHGSRARRVVAARQTPGTASTSQHSTGIVKGRGGALGAVSSPTPTPGSPTASGTVSLANYWVGSQVARHGQTIAVGYVITNGTGRTLHLLLGASVKAERTLSWTQGAVSDPYHDVVAIVPPGTSTHVRYFTVPHHLQPGRYAVAWGLVDSASGSRKDLVAAPSVLRVVG